MLDEIVAYVQSVKHLYPRGIPRSAFGQPRLPLHQKPLQESSKTRIVFLSLEKETRTPSDLFGDDKGQLLRAAIEKGMKLDLASVAVIRSDASTITAFFQQVTASMCILLGVDTAALIPESKGAEIGAFITLPSGAALLVSHDLSGILTSPGVKKAFWSHLQSVLRRLEE